MQRTQFFLQLAVVFSHFAPIHFNQQGAAYIPGRTLGSALPVSRNTWE